MSPKYWAAKFQALIAEAEADRMTVYASEQHYTGMDPETDEYVDVPSGDIYLYVGHFIGDDEADELIAEVSL